MLQRSPLFFAPVGCLVLCGIVKATTYSATGTCTANGFGVTGSVSLDDECKADVSLVPTHPGVTILEVRLSKCPTPNPNGCGCTVGEQTILVVCDALTPCTNPVSVSGLELSDAEINDLHDGLLVIILETSLGDLLVPITNGNQKDPPECCRCPGDLNADGMIDMLDLPLFVDCLVDVGVDCRCADVNGDGKLDGEDVKAMADKLLSGEVCP